MNRRRLAGLAAAVLASSTLLTACSAEPDGIAGIGYDAAGHVVGAIKICHKDAADSILRRGANILAQWHRRPGSTGTQVWRLEPEQDSGWQRAAGDHLTSDPSDSMSFSVYNEGGGWYSEIDFSIKELAAVPRGSILIGVQGPTDSNGYETSATEIIPISKLASQACPTY